MARPRQKRKNKSSLPPIRQRQKPHPSSGLSNTIVAANWSQSLTLQQNYQNLGLTSKLNGPSGGIEKSYRKGNSGGAQKKKKDSLTDFKSSQKDELDVGSVRVIRDEETGKIKEVVRDEAAESRQRKANPLNDPLNYLDDDGDENRSGNPLSATPAASGSTFPTLPEPNPASVVPQLEAVAQRRRRRRHRRLSKREREGLKALVAAHGDDYEGMLHDRALNPMQESVGALKARVGRLGREQQEEGESSMVVDERQNNGEPVEASSKDVGGEDGGMELDEAPGMEV